MSKTAVITVRMEPEIKVQAAEIFKKMGTNISTAINMFLTQTVAQAKMPSRYRVPNAETIAAMDELARGGGTRFTNMTDFHAWLYSDDDLETDNA